MPAESQAESTRKTAFSVYQQELEKLREIEEQIRECKIVAPQDGMVVYFKPESRPVRPDTSRGMIAQGEQVKEGQKLMRIPDLEQMQVNTKVHEAMVGRIRGDDRKSTGVSKSLRAAMLANPDPLSRLRQPSPTTVLDDDPRTCSATRNTHRPRRASGRPSGSMPCPAASSRATSAPSPPSPARPTSCRAT